MPIVSTVMKSKRLPEFVGQSPPSAVRREHVIGQRHMGKFARAYLLVSSRIYGDDVKRRLEEALAKVQAGKMTQEDAVNVIDWYNEADPLSIKMWDILGESLFDAYVAIIEESGQGEYEHHGWPLKFTVQKANGFRVPINPYSVTWARSKAARQVVEISDQQKNLLRRIIADGFERGDRPKEILKEIERLVGLTEREKSWVDNFRERLMKDIERRARKQRKTEEAQERLKETMMGEPLDRAVEKYAKTKLRDRAKSIARTETIDAYSQGLDDAWALAKDEGLIDDTVLQDWVEITASGRTCPICRGLGESDPIPLGQPFVSDIIGEISRPPAHPRCRCTKVLVFVDDEDVAQTRSQADRNANAARAILAGG